MNNNNQRVLCQQLWARNKYLVLIHSSNIYNDIRQYLKHIWGYFKKKATDAERKDYMLLLDRYRFGQASQEDVIAKTRELLELYPNTYLQHSTLLKGDSHETLA